MNVIVLCALLIERMFNDLLPLYFYTIERCENFEVTPSRIDAITSGTTKV